MQNDNILNIYFYDNIKDDLRSFESSALRKNIKASLEINDYRYLTNAIDENIEQVAYINFNDLNKFNFFKGKDFKKISFACYAEFENDTKVFNLLKHKNFLGLNYQIKDTTIKTLNGFDLIFVPSISIKNILIERGLKTNCEVLFPPIKRTKFELKNKETQKLAYIYFHIEENSKYVYTILDNCDNEAAERIVTFAKIFSNIKVIVLIPRFQNKEAKAVKKYFKRFAQNIYPCDILSEDIYASLVYNAFAYLNLNSLYTGSLSVLEAFSCGVNVFSLIDNSFPDILIDKLNCYVYNDFDTLINGFNDFMAGQLPSLSENAKQFMKENDIKHVGAKFIKIYKEYFGE